MSKLIQIPGIVISASRVQAKASALAIVCRGCGDKRYIPVRPGFGGAELPKVCTAAMPEKKCPNNPYSVIPELCTFVDQQILKLQESPEDVPTGEMPRHMQLVVDRYVCCC